LGQGGNHLLKTRTGHALGLAAASFLIIVPFFWLGIPSGHDFEFHMYSWMDVQNQWKQGILFPRWAALAHWGYGEARFIFYPPASWTLGAALGTVLPWRLVPGAYCWLALFLAASAMYRLARQWLSTSDAMFAAVWFALNPYHLLIVYWRSAYAELLASALLPLLFLCVLEIAQPGVLPLLRLSGVLAAAWLINVPAAVMIHYSAAAIAMLLVLLSGWAVVGSKGSESRRDHNKSWASVARHSSLILGRTIAAVVIGTGLSAFYLVPVIHEQRWANLGEVFAPGVRPQDNFLFTKIQDVDHNHFNFLVSSIAASELAVLVLAIWLSMRKRENTTSPARAWNPPKSVSNCAVWKLLAVWGTLSGIAMFPLTNFAWNHLPALRFVQLPFRWLLCLNAALAMLLALAVRSWSLRLMTNIILLGVLLAAGHHFQPPWWDSSADIREMSNAIADGTGYEGIDEYVPAGDDPYELNKAMPRICASSGAAASAKISTWSPMEKRFTVESQIPEDLQLRLFNYPRWKATVNGQPVDIESTEITGLIEISAAAGTNDIRVTFQHTPDEKIGDGVSLVTLVLVAAVPFTIRRTRAAAARGELL
jgi:hypothetical protein